MRDDYKGKEDKRKEIDDFLNEFDKMNEPSRSEGAYGRSEINDKFDQLSSGLKGHARDPFADDAGTTTTAAQRVAARRAETHRKHKKSDVRKEAAQAKKEAAQAKKEAAQAKKEASRARAKAAEDEMTDMPEKKKTKKKKKKKKIGIRILQIFLILVCIVVILCCVAAGWVWSIVKETPEIDPSNIYSMLPENSILYDDEGNVLETLYSADNGLRTNVSYSDMPEDLMNAFIAIEDKTFNEHSGFNVVRIAGAVLDSLKTGDDISGTSTITQQLARNLYLADIKSVRTLERKIQEAYYAIVLEKNLSKPQIIEAYLNTIYLGNNSYGVKAAAQSYFSKDLDELTIAECAVLASIPKNPTANSPLKTTPTTAIDDPDAYDIVVRDDQYTVWYNDAFTSRQQQVLFNMHDQGLITDAEYKRAKAQDIRASMNPPQDLTDEISSYFADYVVNQVLADLMEEYGIDREEARYRLYNGGLRIYSTLDTEVQRVVETEFENVENFPGVQGLNKDKEGNARDKENRILLYNTETYFNEDGSFTLKPEEYQMNEDGSMTIFKGNRLNIYRTEANGIVDFTLEFKPMYMIEEDIFYSRQGGYILIPTEYKSRDDEGNLIISKAFFAEKDWITFTEEGGATIASNHFSLSEKVIQPQAAMVIMDCTNGQIKAMGGGRSTSGKLLYNRALSTRQPGSAIKPIGVYAPALQTGVDAVNSGVLEEGKTLWTAATPIDDAPHFAQVEVGAEDTLWPKNWYTGYRGLYTVRTAVEQSVNVTAVKVLEEIGARYSADFLKKLGITSIVEEGGVNDMNAAALSLGGMTNGISPLELTAAYAAFPNEGIYTEPVSYTKVTNKNGEVLLESEPHVEQAMDRGVAYIMTDILRTTVTRGLGKSASFSGQKVAGKTGTTTDDFDAWFVGFTPYYSAALWIGNDVNIELTQGSSASAKLWSKIMEQIHVDLEPAEFPENPGNVVSVTVDTISGKLPTALSAMDARSTVKPEFFIKGTEPTEEDDAHVIATVCTDSGYLATPYCVNRETKVLSDRPEGSVTKIKFKDPKKGTVEYVVEDIQYEKPDYYCHLHNTDVLLYPTDPYLIDEETGEMPENNFVWDGFTYYDPNLEYTVDEEGNLVPVYPEGYIPPSGVGGESSEYYPPGFIPGYDDPNDEQWADWPWDLYFPPGGGTPGVIDPVVPEVPGVIDPVAPEVPEVPDPGIVNPVPGVIPAE
ncbi:MAG: PBP1A family penicillin-binding protein [Clostridiales bacterium]|nr:PBP1A family penicillin-binding protein [Clostridiales bacterium]